MQRRHFLSATALGATSLLGAMPAFAQSSYPSKPIRVVVPYGPGGITDAIGRKLCEKLAKDLGQPMVVDNRPGAGATVGMAEVARATPDGYTIILSAISPLTLAPYLMKLQYDHHTAMVPVAPVMYSPVYVLATPAFTGKTWEDMIALAKAKPGSIRIATNGVGSVGHIMIEQIQAKTGTELVHVPYKGGSQLINDAAGSHFEIFLDNPAGTTNGLLQKGTLRLLATTGPERAQNQPQVKTLAELGVPEANLISTFGFMAPAKTPQAVIDQLAKAIHHQLGQSDIQELLRSNDNAPLVMSPPEFAQLLKREGANNAAVIQKVGIQL